MSCKVLRIQDVQKLTGLSKSSIYLYIQNGLFPKQIKLGERSVGWKLEDIDQWISEKEYK